MKDRKRAIVAGHICMDITPAFPERKETSWENVIKPGKLIQTGRVDIHTGGAVANTGLALSFLGIDTCLMGKVGRDFLGEMIVSNLQCSQADSGMSVEPESSTSYSIVLALPGIDRIFFHHPGANDTFSSGDIDKKKLEKAHLFHLGYPPLMKMMYEERGTELEKIFKKADTMGVITSLDMAAVDPDSEAGKQDWCDILSRVLPFVDFFFPSLEELCYMIDREHYQELVERIEAGDEKMELSIAGDIEPLARKAQKLGARNLVIKCGAAGLYYCMGGDAVFSKIGLRLSQNMEAWIHRKGFEKSYRPRSVVSGTGAGDTTIAAFLASLLSGLPLENCLKLATATGASCVETYDALSGILPLEEQMKRIRNGLEKQDLIKE